MATPEIGVDGWTGVERWIPEKQEEILKFNNSFKWGRVAELCSSLCDGRTSEVSVKFNVGANKIVKLVQFEDGIKWVAGIVMPPSNTGRVEKRNATNPREQTESEIATYKYLAQYTTLPVPEVFAADSDPNNSLGAPYIIMTFLNGTVADEFPLNEDLHPGTKEQHEYLLRKMADIVVELAQHKFSRIESIF